MTHQDARLSIRDATIRIDSMPAAGRDLVLEVDAGDREQLARQLGILSVDRLSVRLHAVRFRGGIRVTGRVTATVQQASVVSLQPVTQDISEPVDRIFLPGGEKDYAGPANAEIFVDLEGEDMPDHFEGNEADLSDLVAESLALALDPYPRAPGEALETVGDPVIEEEANPFAALLKLKKDLGEG